ncbi:hypothetical protein BTA51_16400 [Hahella sp. CCB-MM4]|nr:hypothetical protein BTA51_16400 [Hahella sp. CCB-MM4]
MPVRVEDVAIDSITMREELIKAFPSLAERGLSEVYIENHPDIMWDIPEISLDRAVPLYMLWCVDHMKEEGSLVFDNTISALNKYARVKNHTANDQNFRFLCDHNQIEVVRTFLRWCRDSLVLDYEPMLSRAIRNWDSDGG